MNTILRASVVVAMTMAACAVALAQGTAPAGDAARGKQLYTTIGCSSCHGTVGQGGGGRTGGLRLANMGIAYPAFLNQLRQPQDEMPPYVASVVPDKDVADIYAYVSSLPPPPDAKSIPILNP